MEERTWPGNEAELEMLVYGSYVACISRWLTALGISTYTPSMLMSVHKVYTRVVTLECSGCAGTGIAKWVQTGMAHF